MDAAGSYIDTFFGRLNHELTHPSPAVAVELSGAPLLMVFVLSGSGGGTWTVCVADGKGDARKRTPDATGSKPHCKIQTSVKVLVKLATGQKNVMAAFMKREIKFAGDRGAFQRIKTALRNAGEAMAPELQSFKDKLNPPAATTTPSKVQQGMGVDFGSIFIQSSNPRWVRDDESNDCLLCGSGFGLMLRRHHCRLCGQLVCGSCSSHQISHKRVCDTCFRARMLPAAPVTSLNNTFESATSTRQAPVGTGTLPRIDANRQQQARGASAGVGGGDTYVPPDPLLMPFGKLRARLHSEQRQPIQTSVTDQRSYSVLDFAYNAINRLRSMEKIISELKPIPLKTRLISFALGVIPKLIVGIPLILSYMELVRASTSILTPPTASVTTIDDNSLLSRLAAAFVTASSGTNASYRVVLASSIVVAMSRFRNVSVASALTAAVAVVGPLRMLKTAQSTWIGLLMPLLSSMDTSVLSTTALSHMFHIAAILSHTPVVTVLSLVVALALTKLHRVFHRHVHIYGVAFAVIFTYFVTDRVMDRILHLSDSAQDRVLGNVHRIMAPFVCEHILQLRSIFVKFGQYLSSRADVVPPEWGNILSKLQDDMPPDAPEYIEKVLEEEFGLPFNELFSSFDFEPMASASVAQVHRGVLCAHSEEAAAGGASSEGLEIAVKIQHEGIAEMIVSDLVSARQIVQVAAWLNPKFLLVFKLQVAWEKEMVKELDFNTEAQNLRQVRTNLQEAGMIAPDGISMDGDSCDGDADEDGVGNGADDNVDDDEGDQVLVPRVVEGFVGKRAFCMTYIDGFKITDKDKLELYGIDKAALVRRVIQAYAYQLYVDGFFNADPHAGNLMVAIDRKTNTARPVLLDFGMVVTLSEEHRRGYCELVRGITQLHISGVSEAIKKVGYQNTQSEAHPERDLQFFQYLMRDTGSRDSQRAATKDFNKMRKAQRSADKDVDPAASGRAFNSFPDSLLFLFRVISLLRGLSAILEVELPYLDIMGDYASLALYLDHDRSTFAKRLLVAPSSVSSVNGRRPSLGQLQMSSQLEVSLRAHVLAVLRCETDADAGDNGDAVSELLGVQVHCIKNGHTVVDVAGGVLGPVDPRPVDTHTLFPLLDLTQVLEALVAIREIDSGLVDVSTPLTEYWPAFAAGDDGGTIGSGRQTVTLGHVLSHTETGLEDAVLPNTSYAKLVDSCTMATNVLTCKVHAPRALSPPAKGINKGSYHTFSYGWCVRGAVGAATATSGSDSNAEKEMSFVQMMLEKVVEPGLAVAEAIGITDDEVVYGGLSEEQARVAATLEIGFASTLRESLMAGGASSMMPQQQQQVVEEEEGIEEVEVVKEKHEMASLSASSSTPSSLKTTSKGNVIKKPQASPQNTAAPADPTGPSIPGRVSMDPAMVNVDAVRTKDVPSVGAFASARGLARVVDTTFHRGIKPKTLKVVSEVLSVENNAMFGKREWGMGFQVYTLVGGVSSGAGVKVLVHHSFGGNFILVCPMLKITIVVTVNKLSLDRSATAAIVSLLCKKLGLGDSSMLFAGGMFG